MTKLDFLIGFQLWEASSSISVMKMLAGQAEKNVVQAISEANLPGAVKHGTYDDEILDEYGEVRLIVQDYYVCGSCVGNDYDEVKSEYIHLISQLTRRSAFLTIFGLFEHRMIECMKFMISLSGYTDDSKRMNRREKLEDCHTILKDVIGGKSIADVDHLIILRNIMAHNDGYASNHNEIAHRKDKKTDGEKRQLRAIHRAESENSGISVNDFNGVLMDGTFLMYTVGEINRYVESLEAAVQAYHKAKTLEPKVQ